MRRTLIGFVLVFSAAFLTAVFVFRPAIGRFLVSFLGERTSWDFSKETRDSASASSTSSAVSNPLPSPTSTPDLVPSPASTTSSPPKPVIKPSGKTSLSSETSCQTSFKTASIYVYEPASHIPENLERLKRAIPIHEKILNKAGRGRLFFDLSYPLISFEVKPEEREKYLALLKKDGSFLALNLQAILKEFYRTNPDDFDFVNVFMSVNSDAVKSSQHVTVQNTIKGIGRSISADGFTSDPERYGSKERLLGINIIHDINKFFYFPFNLETSTEEQIACEMGHTVAHETTHLWAADIGDNETKEADPSGELGTFMPLRSNDGTDVHYSYGLNIGYDPVGGARWQDNKDGTFTLIGPEEWCTPPPPEGSGFPPRLGFPRMSDLTLYLAGAIKKEEVKPMVWFDVFDPEVNPPTLFPFPSLSIGKTIVRSKTVKTITIEEIVKKYGKHECLKRGVRWP